MNKISLLDCTLRDGAYIVDSQFGDTSIRGIIGKLQDAGVEVIECGWLKNKEHVPGSSFFHVPDDLKPYLTSKNSNIIYTLMIDWDRYDLDVLPEYDGTSVDAIRVVFPHDHFREGIAVTRKVKEKGYSVFLQAANTLAYSDEELVTLSEEVNKLQPLALSVVDTFGAMYEDDLERILNVLDSNLLPNIELGFHSHNNQQLSFALCIFFVQYFNDRNRRIMIDASLCGMGRGAGNATTELVMNYLNRKHNSHYNLDAVMDAIDIYMQYYLEHYSWGYSIPYFIAGMNCCHVNNIAYLLNNHRTGSRDMRNIIEALSPAERLKYNYPVLEKKYLEIVSRKTDDASAKEDLKRVFSKSPIILIAPGRSVVSEQKRILEFINEKKAVTIAVNALIPGYDYDYAFFVNPARYEYAKENNSSSFTAPCKIVLSNIKTIPADNEIIVSYDHAIRQGWPHFDNAVICALRLLEWLEIGQVYLAGFDGFKTRYNESYADPYLPTLNPDNKWDELNEEILQMFRDFRTNAVHCKNVLFLTESYFDK